MHTTPSRWHMRGLVLLLAAAIGATTLATAVAQAPAARSGAPPQAAAPAGEKADLLRLFPPDALSRHTLIRDDKHIAYTATAGTLPLLSGKGEISARIFFVAYAIDDRTAGRPVTFVFNGG